MKLTYRGTAYDYTPAAVETTEGELAGKYRGLDWRFCNTHKELVQQPTVELKYRGVAHTTDSEKKSALSTTEKARTLMLDRQRAGQNRQRSLLSRVAAEIGLAL
ncbi:DUF4278 domain-containing protein [Microcoleus sp. FACHB-672]|uniref:DUF4278 domain-containing protein n=1 Tax=Microcoleus sp. FACHB-672 TaxID=2692825 RepID=UPI0016827C56|nr:DUF4278 domain-containing protein [Microcoleus sp. FACHB-672]MBD2040548.1 DUF4278 domain-containing protein [Microcoleus sp. FACHB-672]